MPRSFLFGIVVIAMAAAGLIVATSVGAPHPGTNDRLFLAVVGVVGAAVAISWLQRPLEPAGPASSPRPESERPAVATHPAVVEALDLALTLRLGHTMMADYTRLVEPRLRALARSQLERRGVSLEDRAPATALLGPAYAIVDPLRPPPGDRMAPGVDLADVELLVEALERLS